ncbi:MAG: BT_3928 family protein [Rikenellaceae bacterium]
MEIASNAQRSRTIKIIAYIARVIMGLVFIGSGFVKVVDPWGTAIKINEYLAIYNMEWLKPASMVFAIWLCGAEFMMGHMLLFKVRIRLVSIFAMISMTFFTILSFLSATLLPVEDCGCFGDAIKLTPWQTLIKNIVILPMAFVVWYRYRPDKIFAFKRVEIAMTLIFCVYSMGLGVYNYHHLPMLDFRPYKVGVELQQAIAEAKNVDYQSHTTLIYKELSTGNLREFELTDTLWHDSSRWEWVETRTQSLGEEPSSLSVVEFSIMDFSGEDKTLEILNREGYVHMLIVTNTSRLTPKICGYLSRFVAQVKSRKEGVIILTPQHLDAGKIKLCSNEDIDIYNIDHSTMNTMIRAKYGVVTLRDGVIEDKRNWRDM